MIYKLHNNKMRLLHTDRLELTSFYGDNVPPYAILSHTWGKGEVSLQDLQSGVVQDKAPGYNKIKGCCEVAVADGFEFIWIDTCCIDKSSSTELSEAINSMWTWYKAAGVCYVHLDDVPSGTHDFGPGTAFFKCRWFTRGWTLQELIAPSNLIFYSMDWKELGTKSSLRDTIAQITRIRTDLLLGGDLKSASVAQRMSWASNRDTTRVEDQAYCLMGIFKVHMPMLYGEGRRAFIRLQEEIIKSIDDHTIFAWHGSQWQSDRGSLLASSPAAFHECRYTVKCTFPKKKPNLSKLDINPFSVTNKGIHLELPILTEDATPVTYLAVLDCQSLYKKDYLIALHLERRGDPTLGTDYYARTNYHALASIEPQEASSHSLDSIYVRGYEAYEDITPSLDSVIRLSDYFQSFGIFISEVWPSDKIDGVKSNEVFFTFRSHDRVRGAAILFTSQKMGNFIVLVLYNNNGGSISATIVESGKGTLEEIFGKYWWARPLKIASMRGPEPDRILWPLLDGKNSVSLSIRIQIISGRKVRLILMDIVSSPP